MEDAEFQKRVTEVIDSYYNSGRTQIDLLSTLSQIQLVYEESGCQNRMNDLLQDLSVELIGLFTESASRNEKIVQNSTIKVITEYMLAHLNDIEREIINSSTSKMKFNEKIRKMIAEYINTNYFSKILVVTLVDNMIESVYGDEYTLSKYIYEQIKDLVADRAELDKFIMIYQGTIDSTDVPDFKVSYRKAIVENQNIKSIECDMWRKLRELVGEDVCLQIRNSLAMFKSKKSAFNEGVIAPIIAELDKSTDFVADEFKQIEVGDKTYYGASVYTLEDDNTKFERFITKLRNFGYDEEADLLYTYLINNIVLLTDKVISEKFRRLNDELYEELSVLNKTKYSKMCIGHILLSEPTSEIFDEDGSLNFIVSMVMKSIYKMCEILLINDFEFQEWQKEMLITLQQMSRLRDIETANHQDRVTIYTRILAEELRQCKDDGSLTNLIEDNGITVDTDYYIIDKEYIRDLLYSASLHDLGKVGIDDGILKSEHKLSQEEYEVMKRHTVFGQQRLSSIVKMSRKKSFLVLAAALAENHHERWDGSGYPNGKKAFEIPLSARILAIADVYDALRQERSYKKGMPHDKAVEIIIEGKGTHFDPILIELFRQHSDKFNEAYIKNTWNSQNSSFN
ncbi:MAG: HD domain-containing protein [Spirochaetales bacterium]|nr:HD domain-containing protein [Spirochaetales bacterium]